MLFSCTQQRIFSISSSLTRREIPQHLLALRGVGAMTAFTPCSFRLWIQGRYRDAVTGQEFVAENGGLCVQLEPYQGMMLIRVD